MRRFFPIPWIAGALNAAAVVLVGGCGGGYGGSSTTEAVSVPNVVGQTQTAAAAAITAAGLTVGTVTNASSSTVPLGSVITESPAAGTAVASGSHVALTVSSQTFTVNTTSLPDGTVGIPYSVTLKTSGGTPPVSWTLGTGASPFAPGLSLSSAGVISGTPSVPGSSCFVMLAIDSSTVPRDASQNLCIGVSAADTSHNALLSGHYAFSMSGVTHLSGIPAAALNATAGSFVADGQGNLTGGVSDNDTTGGVTAEQEFIGTYALGSDNRGTLSFSYNNSGGTVTLAFSVGSISPSGVATKGGIITFATTGVPMAGEFELQDTTAFLNPAISGSYAFGFSGYSAIQKQFGAAGVFTADGAGAISTGTSDENINGTFTSDDSLTGIYNIAAGPQSGRGTASLTIAGTTLNMVFYVVSANKLLIISAEQAINPLVFIGRALKQSGGPFNNNSLSGTIVFATTGAGAISYVAGGLATFDGTSNVTLFQDQNEAGTVTLSSTTSETYDVASNGRGTETAGGSTLSVFYLVSAGEGFILDADSKASVGFFERQSAGPFTDSSLKGSFFFGDLPPVYGAALSSGVTALNAGTMNQTSDTNRRDSLVYDAKSVDTYTVSSNGRVTTGSGNEVIYIVSPTKFLVVDVNPADVAPTIMVAEQ